MLEDYLRSKTPFFQKWALMNDQLVLNDAPWDHDYGSDDDPTPAWIGVRSYYYLTRVQSKVLALTSVDWNDKWAVDTHAPRKIAEAALALHLFAEENPNMTISSMYALFPYASVDTRK